MITHDKEVDQQGNPTTPDVHVMLSFRNARYVSAVSKVLGDKPQYIQAWEQSEENGYAYLVHATRKAQAEGKHQYAPSEVRSNFNYADYPLKLKANAIVKAKDKELKAKNLLDAMYAGILTKGEVESRLTGSSRDIFEDYSNEEIIILDELRPKVLVYQDLLRLLDPFGTEVKAPSRYFDKHIAADMIIVTSPYSPYAFWLEQFSTIVKHDGYARKQSLADQGPDGFPQLERRVSATIMVQPGTIDLVAFSDKDGRYTVLSSRVNPYLFVPPAPRCSSEEVFKKMFD